MHVCIGTHEWSISHTLPTVYKWGGVAGEGGREGGRD